MSAFQKSLRRIEALKFPSDVIAVVIERPISHWKRGEGCVTAQPGIYMTNASPVKPSAAVASGKGYVIWRNGSRLPKENA